MHLNIRSSMTRKVLNIGLCALLPAVAVAGREPSASPVHEALHDVVIVGGGIAGLTAGYFLRDKDLLLLEKSNVVGGRTVSGRYRQFTYAKGTEYLGNPEAALACMVSELGLELKEIPSPMDAFFDGQSIHYGDEAIARYLAAHSSRDEYSRFVTLMQSEYQYYDEIPDTHYYGHIRKLDNQDALSWLRENKVPSVYIDKYEVTSRGLFGASLSEISALSLIPEVAFDYEEDEVGDISGSGPDNAERIYAKSGAWTLTQGITALTGKLGEVLGDRIRTGSTVTSITRDGKYYAVNYTSKEGTTTVVLARKVIIATPAPITLNIADTVLSATRRSLLKQIHYAPYATVALFSDEPIFDKAFDLAVPDGYFFTDIYDSTWVERFYNSSVRERPGILSVYIAPRNSHDASVLSMGDGELLKHVYQDLDKIFVSASRNVTGYDIQRFPFGYPVMSPGAYGRLLQLHDDEDEDENIILAGDYMVYPTFEGAVQSGYYAAEKILNAELN